jgi:NADPH:quinone reductase-like Zn-dependent oxidoreductase
VEWERRSTGRATTPRRSVGVGGYSIPASLTVHPDWYGEDVTTLLDLLHRGQITPAIQRTYPLDQATQAHKDIGSGQATGKLLLLPGASKSGESAYPFGS